MVAELKRYILYNLYKRRQLNTITAERVVFELTSFAKESQFSKLLTERAPLSRYCVYCVYCVMVSRYIKYVVEGSLPDSEVGEVELLEPINLQEIFANPGMAVHQQHARTDVRNSPTNELCLIIVPSRMIPTGILQFLLPSLDRISNIKILRHAASTSSYFAVLEMKDEEAYQIIFNEYDGHVFSPSDSFCCCLFPVMSTSGIVTMKDSEEIVTVNVYIFT